MSGFKEYHQYDGLGLAELVRTKQVTARELLTEAIRRAEIVNPKINAINNFLFELAQQSLNHLPEGIFTGVPFLLKDLFSDVQGVITSNGSKAYNNYLPPKDSELVSRYKASGVNIFGKTNTPEFGLMGITEPEAFGPTRNPWNTSLTSGGSSGGSAAAVAARIVPLASGGDGGGSIRIPAAHCGLFGLKPSRGRTPDVGGEHWDGASCEHVLSLSVRDSAAMLDQIQGPGIGAPYVIKPPELSYLAVLDTPLKQLRIAFTTQAPYGGTVALECIRAVEHSAALLADLGHHVEEKTPDFNGDMLLNSYLTMYFGHTAADIVDLKRLLGAEAVKDLEDNTRFLALMGQCLSASDYVSAKRDWFAIKQQMDLFHQDYDLLMTPTTACPPVAVGSLAMSGIKKMQTRLAVAAGAGMAGLCKKVLLDITKDEARKNLDKTPFTQLANLTGQPAMSVPLYWSEDNLPIGIQFVAPYGDETTLFKLAAQLEQAQPWRAKMPDIVGLCS
ncbi:amidase [Thalassomonas viridans]|uniref:Amidase n=1 Tax=Thalassomonas viridans TaxID=137584 RepID=A0AAE9ZG28_9GAMM|nr:amidase [Thalassomonas viridans]WDE09167.1 amidase [Thalassomonas viridans]